MGVARNLFCRTAVDGRNRNSLSVLFAALKLESFSECASSTLMLVAGAGRAETADRRLASQAKKIGTTRVAAVPAKRRKEIAKQGFDAPPATMARMKAGRSAPQRNACWRAPGNGNVVRLVRRAKRYVPTHAVAHAWIAMNARTARLRRDHARRS